MNQTPSKNDLEEEQLAEPGGEHVDAADQAAHRRWLFRVGVLTLLVGASAVAVGVTVGGYGLALAGLGGFWALVGVLQLRRAQKLR